ncbi:FAD-binding oxidoreductase [Streptosporangium sp. NPDC051022]|uniref:FAD-binding oxidoreductase n=1 Tax=Streptosporangium sp. NPDC051022 TaxID=3155752 RepID=UPI0034265A42
MLWSGWGDPAKASELPEPIRALLRDLLGVRAPETRAVGIEEVRLPAVTLPPPVLGELRAAVGADHVRCDDDARVRHTRGKSTPDLMRMRAGDGSEAPDAVVLPGSHADVLEVLRICAAHRVAVVPFGGGTSVVGGLTADRRGFAGVVALDLGRLDRLVSVDAESMTAEMEPGLRAPRAERLLARHGFTLGHFPQSFEYATLGGFAAARSSGQASAGYGRFDDMVVGMTVATPRGTLDLGRAPKSAAGPDLRQVILGSEGAFGVITSLRLRVRRAPAERAYEGWRFESFQAGSAALRRLAQEGPLPTVLRLSDETETMVGLARPGEIGALASGAGCLAIVGYEDTGESGPAGAGEDGAGGTTTGTGGGIASLRERVAAVLSGAGGVCLGPEPGESWARGRYSAPYLRDSLLAAGATVETLETAGFWSGLPRLYDAVRLSLHASLGSPLVMCHVSHVYGTGASLYFTVVTARSGDPVAQWETAKRAVSDAIVAAGGTISHHHGVGRDHREAYAAEIGELGVEILRGIKGRLDPEGILNPGVLIPPL